MVLGVGSGGRERLRGVYGRLNTLVRDLLNHQVTVGPDRLCQEARKHRNTGNNTDPPTGWLARGRRPCGRRRSRRSSRRRRRGRRGRPHTNSTSETVYTRPPPQTQRELDHLVVGRQPAGGAVIRMRPDVHRTRPGLGGHFPLALAAEWKWWVRCAVLLSRKRRCAARAACGLAKPPHPAQPRRRPRRYGPQAPNNVNYLTDVP